MLAVAGHIAIITNSLGNTQVQLCLGIAGQCIGNRFDLPRILLDPNLARSVVARRDGDLDPTETDLVTEANYALA